MQWGGCRAQDPEFLALQSFGSPTGTQAGCGTEPWTGSTPRLEVPTWDGAPGARSGLTDVDGTLGELQSVGLQPPRHGTRAQGVRHPAPPREQAGWREETGCVPSWV